VSRRIEPALLAALRRALDEIPASRHPAISAEIREMLADESPGSMAAGILHLARVSVVNR